MDLQRARELRADQPVDRIASCGHFLVSAIGRDRAQRAQKRFASIGNGAIGGRPRVDALQLDAQPEAMPRGRDDRIGASEAGQPGIAAARVATGERKLRDSTISRAAL